MGGLLHLVQRGGALVGYTAPPSTLFTVPNVTAHRSTADTNLSFDVAVYLSLHSKGLNTPKQTAYLHLSVNVSVVQ